MTFVVETGSGIAGATSYADPDAAGAYHVLRGTEASWEALSDAGYDIGVLIEATRQIDAQCIWKGTIKSTTQGLALPRADITLEDGRVLDGAAQVALAADAAAWLALRLYTDQNASALTSGSAVSESLGSWSVNYGSAVAGAAPNHSELTRMLAPILESGGFSASMRNIKLVRWS